MWTAAISKADKQHEEHRTQIINSLRASLQNVISNILFRYDLPEELKEKICVDIERIFFHGLRPGKSFFSYLEVMVQHSTGAENDQLISGWISAVKLFRRHAGVAKPINEYDDTRGRAWIRYTLNSKLMNDRLLEWLSAGPAEEYFETYSFIRSQHNELLKSLLLAMKYIDFRLRLSSTTPLFIPNADNSMQMEPSRTNPDAGLAALLGASEVPDPLLPIPELETSEPSTTEPTNEAQPAALKSETEAEHRKRKKVKRKIIDLT